MLSLEENSLIIIDDMADTCVKSDLIAQIFKVWSSLKDIFDQIKYKIINF